jgi:hypothetical protein
MPPKALWVSRLVVEPRDVGALLADLAEYGIEAYVADTDALARKVAVDFWTPDRDTDLDFLRPKWLPKRPLPKVAKR